MLTLLLAAASCTGSDVVIDPARRCGSRLRRAPDRGRTARGGKRSRGGTPRSDFEFRIAGEGLDEAKARRAIDLSLEKYCSVVSSLAPDIAITYGCVGLGC